MSPAHRARIRAALERETGRGWSWDSPQMVLFVTDPASRLGVWPDLGTTILFDGAPWDAIATVPTPTGRGWPERLAVEVRRVLSEKATTGGAPGPATMESP